MKIKLGSLASKPFTVSLQRLMKLPDMPATMMFKLRGLAKTIAQEVSKYEEVRLELIKQCAEKDGEGNFVKFAGGDLKLDKKHIDKYDSKMKELNAEEIELPEIKFADLGDKPDLNAEDLFRLEFITE